MIAKKWLQSLRLAHKERFDEQVSPTKAKPCSWIMQRD